MAFNVKRKKRLPAAQEQEEDQNEGTTSSTTSDRSDSDGSSDSVYPCPFIPGWPNVKPSNVVATQSWVSGVLQKFWDWTRFFATKTLRVAGTAHAERVVANEMQSGDIYARRIMLVSPNGNPATLYIDENGEFKVEYDFQEVFFYPGSGDAKIWRFVYRYKDVARNFIGLTPLETALNFVPFESNCHKELNDKVCYRVCTADGEDEVVDKTLLVTCPQTKRIVGLEVLDSDGEHLNYIVDPQEMGQNDVFRKMTINMPSFKAPEAEQYDHIVLPGDFPSICSNVGKPFVPPYLLPMLPPMMVPPVKPIVPPDHLPPALENDIFDDNQSIAISDYFDHLGEEEQVPPEQETQPQPVAANYDVSYDNYSCDTYFNVKLSRDMFEKNKEQYLSAVLEDC